MGGLYGEITLDNSVVNKIHRKIVANTINNEPTIQILKNVQEDDGKEKYDGTWDAYYYNVARAVSQHSKCLSRHIGSVLVKDKSIIGTGYNGPPRGIPSCNNRWGDDPMFDKVVSSSITPQEKTNVCPRKLLGFKSGQGLDWCIAAHSERGALINSARNGICTKNSIMYVTCGVPCTPCLVEIINAGVKEVVLTSVNFYDNSSAYLLLNTDIKFRLYNFLIGKE